MNLPLSVNVNHTLAGVLVKDGNTNDIVFNYRMASDTDDYVSLTMPVRAKSYAGEFGKLPPIFEMHLPEGYLLAIIKKHFAKITPTDDFGLLKLLSKNIQGRVSYDNADTSKSITLNDLLHPSSGNLFNELLSKFALTSALSGVQPKVMAKVKDKAALALQDYIVKAWGDDYPNLAINEYYCMQVMQGAGVVTPEFHLSDDNALFINKRFDIDVDGKFLGFEDMCVLQAYSKDDKYESSYEKVAKTIKTFVSPSNKKQSLIDFFKMMVINTLIGNGDAHLKNFGLIYEGANNIKIAPAFDVVCTTIYIKNDIPALLMFGSKKWANREKLLRFGVEFCDLSEKEVLSLHSECVQSLEKIATQIGHRLHAENNQAVKSFLKMLCQSFNDAIDVAAY
ncbi:MAG: type II toxin-antitoxin system HipA family toxin [Methylococcales symbiont of Hymedesmia sp. n. MRB-2018]|nr:MAG: type II toxin-antitoxin system HipA family toxin [Methylococcales symbiont of Hymedesmia sp. n. MRB-2018]